MKPSLLILAAAALLITADAVHAASSKGHGNAIMTAPAMPSVTPMPSTIPLEPNPNQGALGAPPEFGSPPVNSGLIGPSTQQSINNQPAFGALPGQPGSPSYDPNAALPSLDNPGSALAPTPGTSAAGFNNPSTSSGTSSSTSGGQ